MDLEGVVVHDDLAVVCTIKKKTKHNADRFSRKCSLILIKYALLSWPWPIQILDSQKKEQLTAKPAQALAQRGYHRHKVQNWWI